MRKLLLLALHLALVLSPSYVQAQALPTDGPLTVRPLLQQLGERLLQGKRGSIVAIRPATGEIICLATNTPSGYDVRQAIARPHAPGSTFKVAQALVMLTEGVISEETTVECHDGYTEGNIRVGCHHHASPLPLVSAIAQSCNTWFLTTFASMINDTFMYETPTEAINVWCKHMRSMGLGGPLGIDIEGEKNGLLPTASYLNRRYEGHWTGNTIQWAGMGQGDITLTPLQLCNLAAVIANRGWYITPHIHQATAERPLAQRYTQKRQSTISPEAFTPVVKGMRQAVINGTCRSINTIYPICGKTGTAENAGADHSAFIGFAPMDNPQIAIAVYVEHGGFGADMAAPMASLIIEEFLKGKLSQQSEQLARRMAKTTVMKP